MNPDGIGADRAQKPILRARFQIRPGDRYEYALVGHNVLAPGDLHVAPVDVAQLASPVAFVQERGMDELGMETDAAVPG